MVLIKNIEPGRQKNWQTDLPGLLGGAYRPKGFEIKFWPRTLTK
jgi:hypothetical protein